MSHVLHQLPVSTDIDVLEEFRHRNANYLAHLSAFVHLKAGEAAKHADACGPFATALVLTSVSLLVETIALLNRTVTEPTASTTCDFSGELVHICDEFQSSVGRGMDLRHSIDHGCPVSLEALLPTTQIVTEIIATACSRVLGQSIPGTVMVRLERSGDAKLLLGVNCLWANTVDVPPPEREGSFGHRLVLALCKRIGATVDFERSDKGTSVQVLFPRAVVA